MVWGTLNNKEVPSRTFCPVDRWNGTVNGTKTISIGRIIVIIWTIASGTFSDYWKISNFATIVRMERRETETILARIITTNHNHQVTVGSVKCVLGIGYLLLPNAYYKLRKGVFWFKMIFLTDNSWENNSKILIGTIPLCFQL